MLQEIAGYERSKAKTVITWVFIVLTVGLLRLFFYWVPRLMIRAMYRACSFDRAQVVILKVCNLKVVDERFYFFSNMAAMSACFNRIEMLRFFLSSFSV